MGPEVGSKWSVKGLEEEASEAQSGEASIQLEAEANQTSDTPQRRTPRDGGASGYLQKDTELCVKHSS